MLLVWVLSVVLLSLCWPIQGKCTSTGGLVGMVFLRKGENGSSCMVGDLIEDLVSEILEVRKYSWAGVGMSGILTSTTR